MSSAQNQGKDGGAAVVPAATTPANQDRQSSKRALSPESPPDLSSFDDLGSGDEYVFPKSPPEGVHPNMWKMLTSIHKGLDKISNIENRLTIIDDQLDHDGADIASIKSSVNQLVSANKTLTGRLMRAEAVIHRQQAEITDLKARSMRDNVIIKTNDVKYKEYREENTESTIRKFFKDEMRIPHSEQICINSSHRMGQASAYYNRMLIARLPRRDDHTAIFDNAKALQGTGYSICKQMPAEIEERRQFAWSDFKKAKAEKRAARFDGGTLVVGGTRVTKYDPVPLPALSETLQGHPSRAPPTGVSEVIVDGGHMFKAWAIPASSPQDIREGFDHLIQLPELAEATYVPYAYRFNRTDGKCENFHSDGDISSGLSMVKVFRELSADNTAVFVAHYHASGNPLSRKKKIECLSNVIGGAVIALSAAPRSWMATVVCCYQQ